MTVVNVDYLNFTVPVRNANVSRKVETATETLVVGGPVDALHQVAALAAVFAPSLVAGEPEARGLHGYAWTMALEYPPTGDRGLIAAGGANGETVFCNFGGSVCRHVDLAKLEEMLQDLGGRITRVDLALDDFEGRHTVHDVRKGYLEGQFKNRGQNPSSSLVGPWDTPEKWGEGLTYYVGKLKNGKTLCAYEKGKQLGDATSNWVRFEVRLSRQDRDIPLNVLTCQEAYFFGAYGWLECLTDVPGELKGFVTREETRITLLHLVDHLRRSYGKTVHALRLLGIRGEGLVSKIATLGLPRRLDANYLTPEVREGIAAKLVHDRMPC